MEIRQLTADDAPAIHATLLGDPEVARWLRPHSAFTPAESERLVAAKVAHRTAHGFGWSIGWDGHDCVGWSAAQYCIVAGESEVEIGWSVASDRWRNGFGSALGRHALAEVSTLGLSSIVAYTREDNVASQAVMRALGMSYERAFEHHGLPHVLYRLALS